jgi:hypothetical protein
MVALISEWVSCINMVAFWVWIRALGMFYTGFLLNAKEIELFLKSYLWNLLKSRSSHAPTTVHNMNYERADWDFIGVTSFQKLIEFMLGNCDFKPIQNLTSTMTTNHLVEQTYYKSRSYESLLASAFTPHTNITQRLQQHTTALDRNWTSVTEDYIHTTINLWIQ